MGFWTSLRLKLFPATTRASITVRHAFPMLAVLAALVSVGAVSTSQQSSIRLDADVSTVAAGQPVSVSVYVNAHVPVNAVSMEVEIPPEVRVTGIDTGESVITLWTQQPSVERGRVVLRGGTYRKGFVGEHLIATINAETLTSGVAEFRVRDVQLLAGDGTGRAVAFSAPREGAELIISRPDGTFAQGVPVSVDGAIAFIVVTDIDGDGDVSLQDVSRFMSAWAQKEQRYDFDGDGRTSFRDFGIILYDVFAR